MVRESFKEKIANAPLNILKRPDLFELITKKEISKKVVGEQKAVETITLVRCGAWVQNAQKTSYNLLVHDETGTGKDHVVSAVWEVFPKETTIKRSRISPTAFTYWHRSDKEPEWTWEGKGLYLEDISSGVVNCEVFKVMLSGQGIATITINQQAYDLEVKGKPVMVLTACETVLKNEIIRRLPMMLLDTSRSQTRAIMKKQGQNAVRGKVEEYDPKITEALGLLKSIKVKIPFANWLSEHLPDSRIMRTHHNRILDWIKASTALHQFQRTQDEEGYYLATKQDYEIARRAILSLSTTSSMAGLTRKEKELIQEIKELSQGEFVEVKKILQKTTLFSRAQLYRVLDKLASSDFGVLEKGVAIHIEKMFDGEEVIKEMVGYKVKDQGEVEIPTFEKLQSMSNSVIQKNETIENDEINEIDETDEKIDSSVAIISPVSRISCLIDPMEGQSLTAKDAISGLNKTKESDV